MSAKRATSLSSAVFCSFTGGRQGGRDAQRIPLPPKHPVQVHIRHALLQQVIDCHILMAGMRSGEEGRWCCRLVWPGRGSAGRVGEERRQGGGRRGGELGNGGEGQLRDRSGGARGGGRGSGDAAPGNAHSEQGKALFKGLAEEVHEKGKES